MNTKLLYEISIIRPLVIFLLVVYHCLCIFTGGWHAPAGVGANELYWWLGKLISGFRIECIAFVGGYVMAYQMIRCGKDQHLLPFLYKKVRRLIIPCLVFGLAYWMLFRYNGVWHWRPMLLRLFGGVGHLWFLPMLFWCFAAMWLVARLLQPQRRLWLAVVLLVVLAVVSVLPNPKGLHFGLTQVNHFIFYFYGGYFVWLIKDADRIRLHDPLSRTTLAVLLALLYVMLLVLRLKVGLPHHWNVWVLRALKWGHICCGIMALYLAVMEFLRRRGADYQPPQWVLWCSGICYGVYVFHMFFLQWLYYYSPMPQYVSSWLLPWMALVLTLAGSVLAAWLLKKCKINII